ncbi:capsid cement protein [Pirellulaceae bacterium SH467]
MSQYVDGNTKTFVCDEAIPIYSRVKLDSDSRVTIAGLAEKDIGTATRSTFAAGEFITVKLRTGSGTHKMIASEQIAAGATVYTETDGKVQDTAQATAFIVGTAMEEAIGDGSVFEVLYSTHGDTAVPE